MIYFAMSRPFKESYAFVVFSSAFPSVAPASPRPGDFGSQEESLGHVDVLLCTVLSRGLTWFCS